VGGFPKNEENLPHLPPSEKIAPSGLTWEIDGVPWEYLSSEEK